MAMLLARSREVERAFPVSRLVEMNGKKSVTPSVDSIARANRKRLALEEGALAMADRERQAIDVRKNMERLRELREAREAKDAMNRPALAKAVKTTKRKKKTLE